MYILGDMFGTSQIAYITPTMLMISALTLHCMNSVQGMGYNHIYCLHKSQNRKAFGNIDIRNVNEMLPHVCAAKYPPYTKDRVIT